MFRLLVINQRNICEGAKPAIFLDNFFLPSCFGEPTEVKLATKNSDLFGREILTLRTWPPRICRIYMGTKHYLHRGILRCGIGGPLFWAHLGNKLKAALSAFTTASSLGPWCSPAVRGDFPVSKRLLRGSRPSIKIVEPQEQQRVFS